MESWREHIAVVLTKPVHSDYSFGCTDRKGQTAAVVRIDRLSSSNCYCFSLLPGLLGRTRLSRMCFPGLSCLCNRSCGPNRPAQLKNLLRVLSMSPHRPFMANWRLAFLAISIGTVGRIDRLISINCYFFSSPPRPFRANKTLANFCSWPFLPLQPQLWSE